MPQLYNRLVHPFDPDLDYHLTVAIDEIKLRVEETEIYVRVADDVETFGIIRIEVSPGGSDFNTLLFLNKFSSGVVVNYSFSWTVVQLGAC
jgi:hypothetical protein